MAARRRTLVVTATALALGSFGALVGIWIAMPWVAGDTPFVLDGSNAFLHLPLDPRPPCLRLYRQARRSGLTEPDRRLAAPALGTFGRLHRDPRVHAPPQLWRRCRFMRCAASTRPAALSPASSSGSASSAASSSSAKDCAKRLAPPVHGLRDGERQLPERASPLRAREPKPVLDPLPVRRSHHHLLLEEVVRE